jgi:hypothetical protein
VVALVRRRNRGNTPERTGIRAENVRGLGHAGHPELRLLIRENMIELYVNDYLMNLKRVSYNGRIGFMGDDRQGAFKDISVWQSK